MKEKTSSLIKLNLWKERKKRKKSVYELEFKLLNTNSDNKEDIQLIDKCFTFWHKQWLKTFKDLKLDRRELRSDDFLDREIAVFLYKNEPVILFIFKYFITSKASLSHSYFKEYPEEVKEYLKVNHRKSLVGSYVTVHEEWRRHHTDIPVTEVMFSILARRLLESDAEAIYGYIRRDKFFSECLYRIGAKKLFSGEANNVPVDYCVTTRKRAHISKVKGVKAAVDFLWNRWKKINVKNVA